MRRVRREKKREERREERPGDRKATVIDPLGGGMQIELWGGGIHWLYLSMTARIAMAV